MICSHTKLIYFKYVDNIEKRTCPKGFGLKLAKLGLKIPLKNKVKQKQRKEKQRKAEPS